MSENIFGRRRLKHSEAKTVEQEDDSEDKGEVGAPVERPVVKATVHAIHVASGRSRMAVLDGGKQVTEEDKRLDEYARFWEESCDDFDR